MENRSTINATRIHDGPGIAHDLPDPTGLSQGYVALGEVKTAGTRHGRNADCLPAHDIAVNLRGELEIRGGYVASRVAGAPNEFGAVTK